MKIVENAQSLFFSLCRQNPPLKLSNYQLIWPLLATDIVITRIRRTRILHPFQFLQFRTRHPWSTSSFSLSQSLLCHIPSSRRRAPLRCLLVFARKDFCCCCLEINRGRLIFQVWRRCKDRYRSGYGIQFGTDLQYYITGYSSYRRSHSLDIKACPFFTYPQ